MRWFGEYSILHVVERHVTMAEGWWWDDISILLGTLAHVDVELFHFVNCKD